MMRTIRTLGAVVATSLACGACGSILGIDKDYVDVGDGDAAVADAAVDVAPGVEAGSGPVDGGVSCAGHLCDGVCLDGTDCSSCGSGKLFCPDTHTCLGTCGGCASARIECWSCPGGDKARGSCQPAESAYCLGADYTRCACDTSEACPGSLNVCVSGKCETCGGSGVVTDGRKCKGGTECAAERSVCKN